MLVSLAVSQVLLVRSVDGVDPRFLYAVVALLVVSAGVGLRDVVTSRLALRRRDTPASS